MPRSTTVSALAAGRQLAGKTAALGLGFRDQARAPLKDVRERAHF